MPGANTIRGGFDSHTFPPCFRPRVLGVALLIATLFLTSLSAHADGMDGRVSERSSPFWTSVRSLVFPAWGQLHNGSEKRAVVLFSLQTYFLSRVFIAERRADFYQDQMNEAEPGWEREDLERRYDDLREKRSDMIWWSALLTLFSVIDAYVDAHMVGFDEDVEQVRKVTVGWNVEEEGEVRLAVRVPF